MTTKTNIALVAALVLTSASAVLAAPRHNAVQASFEGRNAGNYYVQSSAEKLWLDRASQNISAGQ